MQDNTLVAEAHERANQILHNCVTPHGFRASGLAAGYPQVWARDNGVIFLGAVAMGDATLL
ncbi:MAG TPA: glycogen debranching protein, partial [Caldilineaceae bacterium]|nr:glycogen debranching protein [Caldilineaceae bacterium]